MTVTFIEQPSFRFNIEIRLLSGFLGQHMSGKFRESAFSQQPLVHLSSASVSSKKSGEFSNTVRTSERLMSLGNNCPVNL